jgi:two-component system, NtrC family, sensor histidine kinase HydH
VAEEARESIFVPFYTTKEKGTGLGLAICQRLVKAHQGTIQLRSAPGEGAEFLVALPGLREEPAPEATRPTVDEGEKAAARERRRAKAEARLRKRRRRKRKQQA